MALITATESITLDGVMQGLGRPDEDTRGGFNHGGWGDGYNDEISMNFAGQGMSNTTAMLFGRRTYADVMAAWTSRTGDGNPFSDFLTMIPKYVVSHTKDITVDFPNTTLLAGDASKNVARLKQETSGTINIIGSGQLVRSLHESGLIDQYILSIHPIVLGSGTHLFGEGQRTDLRLESSAVSTTGVLIGRYSVSTCSPAT